MCVYTHTYAHTRSMTNCLPHTHTHTHTQRIKDKKNQRESMGKLSELVRVQESSQIKINIEKSIAFLYSSNDQFKM